MINGCVKSGNLEEACGNNNPIEALEIFQNMQNRGDMSPHDATLLIVILVVAQLGKIEKGIALHYYLEEKGYSLGGKLGVALIDMYAKCGSIDKMV